MSDVRGVEAGRHVRQKCRKLRIERTYAPDANPDVWQNSCPKTPQNGRFGKVAAFRHLCRNLISVGQFGIRLYPPTSGQVRRSFTSAHQLRSISVKTVVVGVGFGHFGCLDGGGGAAGGGLFGEGGEAVEPGGVGRRSG